MARAALAPVYTEIPSMGIDGRTTLSGARAPLMTDGRVGDFWIDTVARKLYGPKSAASWPDRGLIRGAAGWYPLERIVADGTRRVVQIYDWAGGEGAKPAIGYKTAAGAVSATIADGVDMRGAEGSEMIVSAIDAGIDDVTYDALSVVAKASSDNERQPLKNVFAAGGHMPFRSVSEASAVAIPARVKTVQIALADEAQGGVGHIRQRVATEPEVGPKHRSADRFTPDGGTDSANGGWWSAVSYTEAEPRTAFAAPLFRRWRERLSIRDISPNVSGEAGDDCTAFLQEFFEEIRTRGVRGTMPAGTYDFDEPLDGLFGDNITLSGDNKHSTWLRYTGDAVVGANSSLVKFGSGLSASKNLIVRGIGIKSGTLQSAGYAARLEGITTGEFDMRIDDGGRNCFGGIRALNSNWINLTRSEVASHGDKLAASDVIELYAPEMRVLGELIADVPAGGGIVLGGGVGGFYYGGTLLYCEKGLVVNRSLSANGNKQFFIDTSTFDSCRYSLVELDDDIEDTIGKYIELAGWLGTVTEGNAVWIKNWKQGKVRLTGGGIVNVYGNGVYSEDPTARIRIGDEYTISEIFARPGVAMSGYGIAASVPVVIDSDVAPENCETGYVHPNVTIRHDVHGTSRLRINPLTTWAMDATQLQVSIADGASVALPAGSGVFAISILETGETVLVTVGGAHVKPDASGNFVAETTTPGSGQWSIASSGGVYRLFSNMNATYTFVIAPVVQTRAGL